MRALLLALVVVSAWMTPALAAPSPEQEVRRVAADRRFKAAVKVLAAEHGRTVADIIRLTEIPAPPFGEARRAEAFRQDLESLGLRDVRIDAEGNVTGVRPGRKTGGQGPYVVVAAHLDTVFPAGVPVTVRREGWRLSAPGVGDNTRSLATLLAWVRAMDAAGLRTESDLLIVGNVGEEGAGDLRGVKSLFRAGPYAGRITSFFSVDGSEVLRSA